MTRPLSPARVTRRSLLKASMLGSLGASWPWATSVQASLLFNLDATEMQALALKVTQELPTQVCQAALTSLSRQIDPMTQQGDAAIESTLQVLHADDVAHGRVHEIHGMPFSQTQIGILTSMVRQPGSGVGA